MFRVTTVRRKVAVRAELGIVVHEHRQIFPASAGGFLREGIPEQLHESRDPLQRGGLKVEHPVGVEEQEREVLLSRVVVRVERARCRTAAPRRNRRSRRRLLNAKPTIEGDMRATLSSWSSRPVASRSLAGIRGRRWW